jgi:hypothetical protein
MSGWLRRGFIPSNAAMHSARRPFVLFPPVKRSEKGIRVGAPIELTLLQLSCLKIYSILKVIYYLLNCSFVKRVVK